MVQIVSVSIDIQENVSIDSGICIRLIDPKRIAPNDSTKPNHAPPDVHIVDLVSLMLVGRSDEVKPFSGCQCCEPCTPDGFQENHKALKLRST